MAEVVFRGPDRVPAVLIAELRDLATFVQNLGEILR